MASRSSRRRGAVHGGDQRGDARSLRGGRDRGRRHGLPRRGQGLGLQLALAGGARPTLRVGRADEWTEYTGFLEEGCDAALFVGTHARAGVADGVLNQTISGSDIFELRFNGTPVGETGINVALCGTFGCPVLLVTGDEAVCRESRRAPRRGAHHRRRQGGARAHQCAQYCPSARAEMIEAAPSGRWQTSMRWAYDPDVPARSRST